MGNTPREKALFLFGFTLGGGLIALIITIFGSQKDIANRNLTGAILGVVLVIVALYWRTRIPKK